MQAEAACVLIFRTLGAHRVAVGHLPAQRGPRRLGGLPDDRRDMQAQATLVRLLSITESFTADTLLRHVEPLVRPKSHQTVSLIWDSAAVSATGTWESQQNAYRRWLGVKLDWKPVERLSEARNAVAHGLGELTRRQKRDETSVRAKLATAGIPLAGNRIVLSDAVLATSARTLRDFILLLDLAVQNRPPAHR